MSGTFFSSYNRSRMIDLVVLAVLVMLIPPIVFGLHGLQHHKGIAACPSVPTQTSTAATGSANVITNTSTGGRRTTQHYEYVFPDCEMDVYDMDNNHVLVKTVSLPTQAGVRGVVGNPVTHILYVSYGGDGGANGNGSMLA